MNRWGKGRRKRRDGRDGREGSPKPNVSKGPTYCVTSVLIHNVLLQEALGSTTRRKIASTPESISGFTLRLRSMKVAGELVVDRMWKLGTRRNLMMESRLCGPPTALNRRWQQRRRPRQQLLHHRHDRFIAGPPAARLTGRTLLRDSLIEIS